MQYAMDLDRKRKRFFFFVCATTTILVFGLLCVVNYLEDDAHEIIIDLAVMTILAGGMIALKTRNADSCKRIRDDQGYWNQLEAYLSKHSDVAFSHGLCPECSRKLYPELYPPAA